MKRDPGFTEFKIEKRYVIKDNQQCVKFCVIGMDPEYYEADEELGERFDTYLEAEAYINNLLNDRLAQVK